jgi:FdhD protein
MSRDRRPGPSTRVRVHDASIAVVGRPTTTVGGGSSASSGAQEAPTTVRRHEDRLATEEPLEIRLAWPGRPGRRVAVTMRTPGHDFELATGFLYGEGVILRADDLRTVAYCTDVALSAEQRFNVVTVELAGPPRRAPAERYAGLSAATSACGVCGTESIEDVLGLCDARPGATSAGSSPDTPRWSGLRLRHDVLLALPERLRSQQRVFDSTGGLHAAGLFDETGTPSVIREDVGRHNAVDKAVGARVLAGASPASAVLCVSGRIGFEIVQKAVMADVGVLAAVGAPTSLAVDLARRARLCTTGFVRDGRFVVYTEPERLGV